MEIHLVPLGGSQKSKVKSQNPLILGFCYVLNSGLILRHAVLVEVGISQKLRKVKNSHVFKSPTPKR